MDRQIVVVYCFCDDVLKGLHHYEDPQRQMSDAEVMTTAIVAAQYFAGNLEKSSIFLQEHGYIPKMLEKSRFNRRMHKISGLFLIVFNLLGEVWKQLNNESVYIPLSVQKKQNLYPDGSGLRHIFFSSFDKQLLLFRPRCFDAKPAIPCSR